MAKYGSFVYSTAKYGTGSAGTQPTHTGAYLWTLLIRWDADWVNEAARCVGVRGNRGRKFYVSQGADTFEPVQPGQFYFTLDNYDGRYDPYNTGSPLSGHILPGRAVQFGVKVLANSHTYSIFTGRIRDIRPISGVNQVEVLVVDALQWLADQDITIPVAYNIKVDQAISHTLNAAEYPYPVSLGASNCPITYFDPDEANALDTIRALTDAGIGTAFVDASGALRYYDLTKTGITTHALDQAVLLKEIAVTQPWETVRNKITTIANRFGYGLLEEIWRMDEPFGLDAGTSKTFKIEFEAAKIIQPVRDVDYSFGYSFTTFIPGIGWTDQTYLHLIVLSNITSTGATVTVINNDTVYIYLGYLVVRGNKLVNKKLTFSSTDNTSIGNYGPRRFRIDSPWLQDRGFAEAYATLLKDFLKVPSKSPVIEIETREDGFAIELCDRIALTSAKLGIDVTFDVGGVDFEWLNATGQGFRHILYLQNILYSTATITPQPFYPGLPPVPPVTPPGGGGGGPPVLPPGGETAACLDGTALENGPYIWPARTIDNLSEQTRLDVNFWIRSKYHAHRTRLEIDGLWESQVGGVWAPDATFDFDYMKAYNDRLIDVAHGSLVGNKVADGIRTYIFDNADSYFITELTLSLGDRSSEAPYQDPITGLALVAGPGEFNSLNVTGSTLTQAGGGGGPVVINGVVDFTVTPRNSDGYNEIRMGAMFTAVPNSQVVLDLRCTIAGDYDWFEPYEWWHYRGWGQSLSVYSTFGALPDNALLVGPLNIGPGNSADQHGFVFRCFGHKLPAGTITGHAYFTFIISGTGLVIPTKRVTIRSIKLFNVCS